LIILYIFGEYLIIGGLVMDKEILDMMKSINKEVGTEDTRIVLGDEKVNVDAISTGSIAIDDAIGIGGFPRGRIVEIFGPESCGKTTTTLCTIAAAQARGEVCAFIDAEHALDPKLAEGVGVNWNDLLFVQPNYGEQALTFAEKLILSGKVSIIVVDSVAALIPKQEYEGEIDGKEAPGAMARMMAKGIRKLTGAINKSNCVLIFINQIREKIGVMFGSNELTPGGRALKFAASIRMEVKRTESITAGKDNIIGNKVRVTLVKNKVAVPYKKVIVDLIYGKGIDNTSDIIDKAVSYEIVNKKGSTWHQYKDHNVNGKSAFIEKMKEEGLLDEIEKETRKMMVSSVDLTTTLDYEEDDEEDENQS
jgi:recombination protein RecA